MNFLIYLATIIFNSWAIGTIITLYLQKKNIVARSLSNLQIIKSDNWNKYLGVNIFKTVVTKTLYGKINKSLKLSGRDYHDLIELRKKMTDGEIGHLVGFISAQIIFIIVYVKYVDELFFLIGTLLNLILNFYPVLLQQKNKSRIDKILNRYCC